MHGAFQNAIAEHNYKGAYSCVLPDQGEPAASGGRGSLRIRQAVQVWPGSGFRSRSFSRCSPSRDNETPIICNGFKDDEYIQMVMMAKKIGRNIIPVVEKYTELDLILKHAAQVGVRPVIGVRVKLASRGSGRWKSSGGYRSKFGLTLVGGATRAGTVEEHGHGRLSPTAPFPSGQPDHEYSPDQGRGYGSGPRFRRTAPLGRRAYR